MGYANSYMDLSKKDENNGILFTGDIAIRGSDKNYYIVGRKKRFLKLFGNRVSLDEIEEIINAYGYECACAGTDDNLKIFITKPDNNNHITSYISKLMGINKSGFNSICIEKIPRNESGKIQYSLLENL